MTSAKTDEPSQFVSAAPLLPPPLLSEAETYSLIQQGHLPIKLPTQLQDLYNELFRLLSLFFEQPTEQKQQDYPAKHGTELGYYPVAGEKEYLTLRHATHSNSELERVAAEVWKRSAGLLHRILVNISYALWVPPEAWDPVLSGTLTLPSGLEDTTPTLLRMFKYLPQSGIAEAHTDNGMLTLCVGAGRGLQVLNRSFEKGKKDSWCDAQGPTVLIGSTLRALSMQRVNAGLHRVIGNPDGRNSIVFTLRPSIKHTLDLTPLGGHGTVDLKQMWLDIQSSKFNVNAVHEIRDKQKKEQEEKYGRKIDDEGSVTRLGRLAKWKASLRRRSQSRRQAMKSEHDPP